MQILTTNKVSTNGIKNKGTIYEYEIFNLLVDKKVQVASTPAGGKADSADSVFAHNLDNYKLEIKSKHNPDYGQKRIHYYPDKKIWNWAKDTEVTRFYNQLDLKENIDKNFDPIWYRKRKKIGNKYQEVEKYTEVDKRSDQKEFEKSNIDIPNEALFKYYKERGTYYIQIEKSGFYHLFSDIASLGTKQFDGRLKFRFRVKYQGQGAPPHRLQFMGIMKPGRAPTKSKYNIDNSANQLFPPIKPFQKLKFL